jgi:purine-binding chemotaxis protein CheW
MNDRPPNPALLVRVPGAVCAFPLTEVIETMRPLPIAPLAIQSDFIQGVARIRGEVVPVLQLTGLFHGDGHCELPTRFVTLRVGERSVALAVQSVMGIVDLSAHDFGNLPPLLKTVRSQLIQSLGTLDAELLVMLDTARLVPDSIWQALSQMRAAL